MFSVWDFGNRFMKIFSVIWHAILNDVVIDLECKVSSRQGEKFSPDHGSSVGLRISLAKRRCCLTR